jgi:hypothetical protein
MYTIPLTKETAQASLFGASTFLFNLFHNNEEEKSCQMR